MKHDLAVCRLVEYQQRLDWRDVIFNADELCTQIYMDVLGHGFNGGL